MFMVEDLCLFKVMVAVGVDFVVVSFVRAVEDIDVVWVLIGVGCLVFVVKIEMVLAIADFDCIFVMLDVVMVVCGDLGIECLLEDVFYL